MACHESIKDLLHKTLGLNGAGFLDICDGRTTLELNGTAETNMLSWKGTGFTFFCVHVVLWPSEEAAKS